MRTVWNLSTNFTLLTLVTPQRQKAVSKTKTEAQKIKNSFEKSNFIGPPSTSQKPEHYRVSGRDFSGKLQTTA